MNTSREDSYTIWWWKYSLGGGVGLIKPFGLVRVINL